MQIETYRTRLEEFEQSLNRELYLHCAGIKDQLELKAVYSDYTDLFSVESIREIQSELQNTGESFSSRRKSLKKIHEYLIDQHLDCRISPLVQEADRFARQQTLTWDGRPVALFRVPSLFPRERDAERRRKLCEQYAEALGDLEGLMRDKMARLRSAAESLGFKGYLEAREYITGVDYAGLLDAVDDALARLDDGYRERLRVSVEAALGIPLQEAGSWDVARWRLLQDPVQVFSETDLRSVLEATVREMGIRPENSEAISIDLDSRPGKHARPFCIPIRIPHEIKIVMCPEPGCRQYAALLHESGHASHFAWTAGSLPIEQRVWGDRALSEGYAFLFERFLLDPGWLVRMFSFVKSGAFLRFQFLYRAFLVRRCAARLRFALKLCRDGNLGGISQIYAETMRSGTGLQHPPGMWLADFSDGLDAADYLRGWMLECMLREYLCRRYGREWMRSRAAAGFLKEIWETGQLYRADELARELGLGGLEPQILADDLSGGLQY